ncbi:MAG: 1-deoxy-D-xylulose-5-phosphate reductoisomerase, partial [Candidatus Peregrinibacteria bacterium]
LSTPKPKNIVLLGSTGSLGRQALQVIQEYPKHFKILALSARKNLALLKKQTQKFHPNYASPPKSLTYLAALPQADIIINALSGTAGIAPRLTAVKAKKTLLLANKESIVSEGKKLKNAIPLDSEHNAIHEILKLHPDSEIDYIVLPCSGGPFLKNKNLANITPQKALHHPKWKMGPKISIESATLINKGLEIIEAHYLFNLPISKIKVHIHPQAQIHGIVKFAHKPQPIAYFASPDMREHIENALLQTINKTKKRTIRRLPKTFTPAPPPPHLKGIDLVLNAFKKNPKKMKTFLKKEETVIHNFLKNKISFEEIFKKLSA